MWTCADYLPHCSYDIHKSVVEKDKYEAFVELHIDQSEKMKYENKPVAVVDGIAAPLRVKVIIHGEAAHSGSTAMRYRKDALVIANMQLNKCFILILFYNTFMNIIKIIACFFHSFYKGYAIIINTLLPLHQILL